MHRRLLGCLVAMLAAASFLLVIGLRSYVSMNLMRSFRSLRKCKVLPQGLPKVVPGRHYAFITHHKTGTNFMGELCEIMAFNLSEGKERCARCAQVIAAKSNDSSPACTLPSDHAPQANFTNRFGRFTLVTNMFDAEFDTMRKHASDFRAVHMIRDPVAMVISSYRYDSLLSSPAALPWRWDSIVKDLVKQNSTKSGLTAEAKGMLQYIRGMCVTHRRAARDGRVVPLSLEQFQANYSGTLRKMIHHMFEDVTAEQLHHLMDRLARKSNMLHHLMDRLARKSNMRNPAWEASRVGNRTELVKAWSELAKESGDPDIREVEVCAKNMAKEFGRTVHR